MNMGEFRVLTAELPDGVDLQLQAAFATHGDSCDVRSIWLTDKGVLVMRDFHLQVQPITVALVVGECEPDYNSRITCEV